MERGARLCPGRTSIRRRREGIPEDRQRGRRAQQRHEERERGPSGAGRVVHGRATSVQECAQSPRGARTLGRQAYGACSASSARGTRSSKRTSQGRATTRIEGAPSRRKCDRRRSRVCSDSARWRPRRTAAVSSICRRHGSGRSNSNSNDDDSPCSVAVALASAERRAKVLPPEVGRQAAAAFSGPDDLSCKHEPGVITDLCSVVAQCGHGPSVSTARIDFLRASGVAPAQPNRSAAPPQRNRPAARHAFRFWEAAGRARSTPRASRAAPACRPTSTETLCFDPSRGDRS